MSAIRNNKSNIQLFATRRCHLRCRYCPIVKGDADMPLATALKAARFLLGHRNRSLRLDFGGGEPLLNFDVVRETVEYAERLAGEKGKELSFYMVTNGVELDADKLAWMGRRKFLLELSLDGDRETHNRCKVAHARGLDPYEATRRAVELAVRSGVPHFVIAVATPATAERLGENFEHLLELGVRDVDISYALGSRWTRADEDLFFSQLDKIVSRHRPSLSRGEIRLGNLRERVEPTILNSELMVDTDGSLHLLSEWMFETSRPGLAAPYRLGSVDDGTDINRLYWSRFHCYYTLVRMFDNDPELRKTLLNNIALGLRAGKYFAALRETVHGGGLCAVGA